MANSNSSGSGNLFSQLAVAALTTGANAITRGGPKRQYKYNKRMAEFQNALNRENMEYALANERALRDEQRLYESPAAQMARYQEAGLNPNLVYGQGTPGNVGPTHAPSPMAVNAGQIDASVLGSLGTDFQQARLMAAQADLTRTREQETSAKTELTQVKTEIAKANPYLRQGYVDSVVSQLESTAKLKEQEAAFMLAQSQDSAANGFIKMQADIDAVVSRFRLNQKDLTIRDLHEILKGQEIDLNEIRKDVMREDRTGKFLDVQRKQQYLQYGDLDLKIRAAILQSKEFDNVLKEIQTSWLRDGEITPEHIRQGIMMLMQAFVSGYGKK